MNSFEFTLIKFREGRSGLSLTTLDRNSPNHPSNPVRLLKAERRRAAAEVFIPLEYPAGDLMHPPV